MFFAIDSKGNRVFVKAAHVKDDYFCPICQAKVFIKRGIRIQAHFSHYPNRACLDAWHYEPMGEWHLGWQERFPLSAREIVKTANGKTHRADVLLEDSKTVIEFQHSPLTRGEFEERNAFYLSLGYRVVWVFDARDSFREKTIAPLHGELGKWKWLNPIRALSRYAVDPKIAVFLESQSDPVRLEKIVWVAPSGIERLCTEPLEWNGFSAFVRNRPTPASFEPKTIPYIAKTHRIHLFAVKNEISGDRVLIVSDPVNQYLKYHRIYGRKEDTFGDFKPESEWIPDANRPVWRLTWKKKTD